MPYKSKKQKIWMHINKPEIAEKWDKEEKIKKKRKPKSKKKK